MTADEKRGRARRATRVFLVMALIGSPLTLCLALPILRVVGFRTWEFAGPSMEPAYCDGDRVFTTPPTGLARGDVIVVHSPADDVDVIKRVVAVGGDRIEIADDAIVLNGERIEQRELGPASGAAAQEGTVCLEERIGDRSWRIVRDAVPFPESMPELLVPEGHVFVLGDHRDRSNDSRNPRIGTVPLDRVLGRVSRTYWSAAARVTCPE